MSIIKNLLKAETITPGRAWCQIVGRRPKRKREIASRVTLKDAAQLQVEVLETFRRSNQDTCLVHKPVVNVGEWVQSGDLLADNSASKNGELAIGQNILVAYMPWEGFNYEDAILINERLVYEDIYTSIHIERYEIEIKESKLGGERMTRTIPDLPTEATAHLDEHGIASVGSWIEEGSILVGKVTPIDKKAQTPYQRLLFKLLDKKLNSVRDSSFRAPKGIKANVINVQIIGWRAETYKKNISQDSHTQLSLAQSAPISTLGGVGKTGRKPTQSSTPGQLGKARLNSSKAITATMRELQPKVVLRTVSGRQNSDLTVASDVNTSSPSLSTLRGAEWGKHFTHRTLQVNQNTAGGRRPKKKSYWFTGKAGTKNTPALGGIKKKNSGFAGSFDKLGVPKISSTRSAGAQNWGLFEDFKLAQEGLNQKSAGDRAGKTATRYTRDPLEKHKSSLYNLSGGRQDQNNKALFTVPQQNARVTLKHTDPLNPLFGKGAFGKTNSSLLPRIYSGGNIKQTQSPRGGVSGINLIPTNVHIYLAEKRKIQVGDKMAGRHGNKGIISNILPRQDMPYLPDGTAIDIVLNPLGVPSRMNVGQIYECLLGLAGKYLGEHYKIFPFDEIYGPEASRSFVFSKLFEASKKTGIEWLFDPNTPGKMRIFDGRTSECFHQPITVGIAYMLKLVHMVDDKLHMRSTGPYSLVTQQPLRGRAKQGGQRLGEMEVWAIEGYGASYVLLEMLTLKSDDMTGRLTLWSDIILNKDITIGTPESFKVLVCELQALCLDIGLFKPIRRNSVTVPSYSTTRSENAAAAERGYSVPSLNQGKENSSDDLNKDARAWFTSRAGAPAGGSKTTKNRLRSGLRLQEISHLMLLP